MVLTVLRTARYHPVTEVYAFNQDRDRVGKAISFIIMMKRI